MALWLFSEPFAVLLIVYVDMTSSDSGLVEFESNKALLSPQNLYTYVISLEHYSYILFTLLSKYLHVRVYIGQRFELNNGKY